MQGLKARIEEILPAEEPAEALSAQSEEGTSKHAAVGTSLSTSTSKRERSKSSLKEYVGAILREFVLSRVPANANGSGEDAEEEERASKRTKVHHQHTHVSAKLGGNNASRAVLLSADESTPVCDAINAGRRRAVAAVG